jgi:hypothetical protein
MTGAFCHHNDKSDLKRNLGTGGVPTPTTTSTMTKTTGVSLSAKRKVAAGRRWTR